MVHQQTLFAEWSAGMHPVRLLVQLRFGCARRPRLNPNHGCRVRTPTPGTASASATCWSPRASRSPARPAQSECSSAMAMRSGLPLASRVHSEHRRRAQIKWSLRGHQPYWSLRQGMARTRCSWSACEVSWLTREDRDMEAGGCAVHEQLWICPAAQLDSILDLLCTFVIPSWQAPTWPI